MGTTTEENRPVNQWAEMNRLLFIYKIASAGNSILCALLVILCFVLSSRDPIVAIAASDDYLLVNGKRTSLELNEANIRRFIERFVKGYYVWKTLNPEEITRQIEPIATEGFREKIFTSLKERKEKVFPGKKVSQDIAGLQVEVTEENTTATFDVVLRVDGLPLIVPTQIRFQLVKAPATDWNPIGLFVNGATVHEGK